MVRYLPLYLSLLLSTILTSCARFYNMPPAETGVVEEAGDIQIAGQQGSKGRSLSAAFGFHNLQKREFDADYLPLDPAEADSLIALGRVVGGADLCLYGLFQWYSHSRSPNDGSDLRDQVEYNVGSGIAIIRYERDGEGRRRWPGLTGLSYVARFRSASAMAGSRRSILVLNPISHGNTPPARLMPTISVPGYSCSQDSRFRCFRSLFAFLAGDWAYDYGVLGIRLTL